MSGRQVSAQTSPLVGDTSSFIPNSLRQSPIYKAPSADVVVDSPVQRHSTAPPLSTLMSPFRAAAPLSATVAPTPAYPQSQSARTPNWDSNASPPSAPRINNHRELPSGFTRASPASRAGGSTTAGSSTKDMHIEKRDKLLTFETLGQMFGTDRSTAGSVAGGANNRRRSRDLISLPDFGVPMQTNPFGSNNRGKGMPNRIRFDSITSNFSIAPSSTGGGAPLDSCGDRLASLWSVAAGLRTGGAAPSSLSPLAAAGGGGGTGKWNGRNLSGRSPTALSLPHFSSLDNLAAFHSSTGGKDGIDLKAIFAKANAAHNATGKPRPSLPPLDENWSNDAASMRAGGTSVPRLRNTPATRNGILGHQPRTPRSVATDSVISDADCSSIVSSVADQRYHRHGHHPRHANSQHVLLRGSSATLVAPPPSRSASVISRRSPRVHTDRDGNGKHRPKNSRRNRSLSSETLESTRHRHHRHRRHRYTSAYDIVPSDPRRHVAQYTHGDPHGFGGGAPYGGQHHHGAIPPWGPYSRPRAATGGHYHPNYPASVGGIGGQHVMALTPIASRSMLTCNREFQRCFPNVYQGLCKGLLDVNRLIAQEVVIPVKEEVSLHKSSIRSRWAVTAAISEHLWKAVHGKFPDPKIAPRLVRRVAEYFYDKIEAGVQEAEDERSLLQWLLRFDVENAIDVRVTTSMAVGLNSVISNIEGAAHIRRKKGNMLGLISKDMIVVDLEVVIKALFLNGGQLREINNDPMFSDCIMAGENRFAAQFILPP